MPLGTTTRFRFIPLLKSIDSVGFGGMSIMDVRGGMGFSVGGTSVIGEPKRGKTRSV